MDDPGPPDDEEGPGSPPEDDDVDDPALPPDDDVDEDPEPPLDDDEDEPGPGVPEGDVASAGGELVEPSDPGAGEPGSRFVPPVLQFVVGAPGPAGTLA